jgi:hypothetical protein
VKSIRPYLVIAVMAASAASVGPAIAGTGCQDDPEHCVERGATTTRRNVVVAQSSARVTPAPVATAPVAQPVVARKATPTHKSSNKPARVAQTPAPATPGMGMLLKLSNGGGGDVSLFPSRPTDNSTGASWVL